MLTREERRAKAVEYLGKRTGKMEYRFIRYGAVVDVLQNMGLTDQHIILDVGAGMGDFDFYLRTVRGFKGRYVPVDASIDGVDLEEWAAFCQYDFVVAIEVLEHLRFPKAMLAKLQHTATIGAVVTTPNTDRLGREAVWKMDETHITPIYQYNLRPDWIVEVRSFFGTYADSILAYWQRR